MDIFKCVFNFLETTLLKECYKKENKIYKYNSGYYYDSEDKQWKWWWENELWIWSWRDDDALRFYYLMGENMTWRLYDSPYNICWDEFGYDHPQIAWDEWEKKQLFIFIIKKIKSYYLAMEIIEYL